MDERVKISKPNPYESANFFSRIFIFFISPLLKLGKKRPLEDEDLPDTCKEEESILLSTKLENEWNKELKKKKPSLLKCLIRLFWLKITLNSLLLFIEVK